MLDIYWPCDLTLYPSGKLLMKTENKELAAEVAKKHVLEWVIDCENMDVISID